MQQLQPNTLLQGGRYKIIETLGQGGFGITYLAIQSGLDRKVAIKEFFMKELCERDESTSHVTLGTEGSKETVSRFREKFLKEARNIARLNHPNIVRIIDVFEENGTAYYVMEYAENGSLAEKVRREGYLAEPIAIRYIIQVAEALDYIHQQKMNHLDVKPANIMINEKDECVLIDFGLSKQYDIITGNQTSTTPVGISEGYAPMEQYMQGGVGAFSPETDIYALGATLYKLLTSVTPPNASFVNNEGLPIDELKAKGVSEKTIAVICKAMEGRKKDRIKSVRIFKDSLNAATTSTVHASTSGNEATIFTSEMQYAGEEQKRKETEAEEKTQINEENDYSYDEDREEEVSNIFSSKKIIIVSIGIIVCCILGYFIFSKNSAPQPVTNKYIDTLTNDTITTTQSSTETYNSTNDDNTEIAEIQEKQIEERAPIKEKAIIEKTHTDKSDSDDSDKVFEVVDIMPAYPGGNVALMQYLSSHIKYPSKAEANGIQGRVICNFIVEKNGAITNVKIVHSIHPTLDKEAVRVIKTMPKWIPGKINGEPVRVKYVLPVTFRLE